MKTASEVIWALHGAEQRADCEPCDCPCWVCGGTATSGQPVTKWNGASFTGQNKIRCPASSHVCEPCVFVCSRVAPVLGRPPGVCKVCDGTAKVVTVPPKGKGKDAAVGDHCPKCGGSGAQSLGANFRNVSHLYEHQWTGGAQAPGYTNASKGEKPLVREFLARVHGGEWFAAIADSGQKHVIPWTPVNPVGGTRAGWVMFDEELVFVPDDQGAIGAMTQLLSIGLTKDEISSGDYRARILVDHRESVDDFEATYGADRGSGWFALALWLSQRDEEQYAENKERAASAARNKDRRVRVSRSKRVPQYRERKAPTVVLADIAEQDSGSGATDRHGERMGSERAKGDANSGTRQLTLTGFD